MWRKLYTFRSNYDISLKTIIAINNNTEQLVLNENKRTRKDNINKLLLAITLYEMY